MTTQTNPTAAYGDTPQRNYADKLALFNRFVEPELRQFIASLEIRPGDRVLDAGCGMGQSTKWLSEATAPNGITIGLDLAYAHARDARQITSNVVQANLVHLPFAPGCFDWVWSGNTLNHMQQPHEALSTLAHGLKPGGHLLVGQSSFLPDMMLAWDARLEREVTYACRKYFCNKYGLNEQDLSAPRNWVGLLRQAGFINVRGQTIVIERIAPLSADDEFFFDQFFKNYWAHRVQPYLSPDDWAEIQHLTDSNSPGFAPRRSDFHHIQTYTAVIGVRP